MWGVQCFATDSLLVPRFVFAWRSRVRFRKCRQPCSAMGIIERYLRNRSKLQIFTNLGSIVGGSIFALQNLTTNWGGNYSDDPSLTDAAQVRRTLVWPHAMCFVS